MALGHNIKEDLFLLSDTKEVTLFFRILMGNEPNKITLVKPVHNNREGPNYLDHLLKS